MTDRVLLKFILWFEGFWGFFIDINTSIFLGEVIVIYSYFL